mmetsp:Transcript_6368/g.21450  ORF Transcript_6368/g.21450 Transcript_6368/m.21450 type:complete len:215 (-) Transcript_6368:461-1105(-)
MLGQERAHLALDELLRLLRRAADEERGVEERIERVVHGGEAAVAAHAGDEVVGLALLLHAPPRLHAVLPDGLVQLLAVAAGLHGRHEDVLRGHEGQLGHDARANDRGVDDEPRGDVGGGGEDHVGGEERLGEVQTPRRGVVQRALEPLVGVGVGRGGGGRHEVPREGAAALAAHGVALVRHGARPDLVLAEGLLHLLEVREQAQVGAHLVHALG